MGKGRWVGGLRGRGEGVSEAGRRTGGEKEVRDGEVEELFIHKVFWCTRTGWSNLVRLERLWGTWETFLHLDAGGIQWLHKYPLWSVLNCKQTRSYLTSRRDINGDNSVCDFSKKQTKEEHKAAARCNNRHFNCGSHANEALVQPLWKSTPTHVHSHTHNLTTTSPVSGSLIKLTGAGLSGQARTSEPSPSCHDMMDLSTTGCQAATQVHLPVGVHQETLAKHPVDLICIYPPSSFTSKSDCMSKGRSRLALLATSSLSLTVNMWMDVYLCTTG